MRIEIHLPDGLKGYGVEIINANKDCAFLLALPEVKAAKGFLQCRSLDYSLIEFWTDEENLILNACVAVEKALFV